MTSTPRAAAFGMAVRRADELFADGYAPLGARLLARSVAGGTVTYQLAYRSWRLVIRLNPRRRNDPDSPTEFSCRLVGRSGVDAVHDAMPFTEPGSPIVEPVRLGARNFEGVAECMAEVYHRVIHRPDVQRAIRRDLRWPMSS